MTSHRLTGSARIAGVFGWPVGHSLSPPLHGYWLERYGIDGVCVPLAVRPKDLPLALAALPCLGFRGASVTIPHKEAALQLVQRASNQAARIGAVNLIVVLEDGTLLGDNSDAYGFIENLRNAHSAWRPAAGPALVLGAGGSARAVCTGLLDAGVPAVRICNRNRERAESLARVLRGSVEVVSWDRRGEVLDDVSLVVNTTALGMVGQPPLEIDLSNLAGGAVVTDLVYRPLRTGLLTAASARGNPVVDGLGMLLHQARPAFAAWYGVDPEVTPELRAFVLQGTEGTCSSSD